jgi:hypothetical protein
MGMGFMTSRNESDDGGKRSASEWMKGVQIEPESVDLGSSSDSISWNVESLGTELSQVGQKFPKVDFEMVNVAERKCTISLSGPWAQNDEIAFIRLHLVFPDEYPESKTPYFELEETSGVSSHRRQEMTRFLQRISALHVRKGRPCIESCLRYLVGEKAASAKWRVRQSGDSDTESDTEGATSMEESTILSAVTRENNGAHGG